MINKLWYFVFAIKTGNCTLLKRKMKGVNFSIVGDPIPTAKENSGKRVGKWCENGLSGKCKGIEIIKQAENGLRQLIKPP